MAKKKHAWVRQYFNSFKSLSQRQHKSGPVILNKTFSFNLHYFRNFICLYLFIYFNQKWARRVNETYSNDFHIVELWISSDIYKDLFFFLNLKREKCRLRPCVVCKPDFGHSGVRCVAGLGYETQCLVCARCYYTIILGQQDFVSVSHSACRTTEAASVCVLAKCTPASGPVYTWL